MSNSAPTGWLVILGDALIGETLTARTNSVVDADGINTNTASFQWLRDGEPIPGATGQTYQVSANDAGAEISVQYMYRDNRGNSETVTSKPEDPVPTYVYVNTTPILPPIATLIFMKRRTTASRPDGCSSLVMRRLATP